MGPFGHCALGMAAKHLAPKAPLGLLLFATESLDLLVIAFVFAGIEHAESGASGSGATVAPFHPT
jgi:hypothetical protein